MKPDEPAGGRALIDRLVRGQAGDWDRAARLPETVLRRLGSAGLLCAEVPRRYGGAGLSSRASGELTAYVGSLCGSVRSIMTSQGMAAWTIQRLGEEQQRAAFLAQLTSGTLAAVGFSEPQAGSDLSAMTTRLRRDGGEFILSGRKTWVTGAQYADLLVIFGQYAGSMAAAVVPASAPGVSIEPVTDPAGCRAAGHAAVALDDVRLPAEHIIGDGQAPPALLVTTALAYGRISVAWGCTGMLRCCLAAAAGHAAGHEQFGVPIREHQLVARHLTDLFAAEQIAARCCEHASRCWDARSPELVPATVLAKYVSSAQAVRGAAAAMQVMASAAARDGHPVARAYRDAKLMEVIEGTSEICQLILAEHALATTR